MGSSADDWFAVPVLAGSLVRLEALTVEHAEGYAAAAAATTTNADGGSDASAAAEVFRWMSTRAPAGPRDARQHIVAALAARARGERLPYAQLDGRTGRVIGSTSYYEVQPTSRALAIGYTWLGRPWWRTGHNTEAKLLLLRQAFDVLGAARVVWHTDIRNVRSQVAIERLGAGKEGVLRKHRIRPDGSWRDTVQYSMTDDEWPQARDRLTTRLASGTPND
jgi:N-acetyltransferase